MNDKNKELNDIRVDRRLKWRLKSKLETEKKQVEVRNQLNEKNLINDRKRNIPNVSLEISKKSKILKDPLEPITPEAKALSQTKSTVLKNVPHVDHQYCAMEENPKDSKKEQADNNNVKIDYYVIVHPPSLPVLSVPPVLPVPPVSSVPSIPFLASAPPKPKFVDAAVQVDTRDSEQRPRFHDNLTTDAELKTATGIESFEVLDRILELLAHMSGENEKKSRMSLKEKVIMTFIKLRQNISYTFLAIMFQCCTARHCQRIFTDTVKMLSQCLKTMIPWPTKEEIQTNIPECFETFKNVRVVLDCIEVSTQRPDEPYHKGPETYKIMIGVSPAGNITYVSKCFKEKESDSMIFQQSDIIQLLEPGDAVMVDRGFSINDICEMTQLKCIRPPLLKDKKQLSKEQLTLVDKISKARVYIKKTNLLIRAFKIVGSVIPTTLISSVEDIYIIICGVINLSAPNFNDTKFREQLVNLMQSSNAKTNVHPH